MSAFNPIRRNESLPAQVAAALYRISQAVNSMLRVRGEETGFSPAQIQALLFLQYARPGVRTIGGLADRLAIADATASKVADALERKRLIRRKPLAEDKRTITLTLTAEGARKAVSVEDVLADVEAAIASLPEAEQAALQRAAQAIVRRLQAAGYIKVYEMCWNCQFFRREAHPNDPRGPHHCAFVDAPLPDAETYLECPDFVPLEY